MLTGLPLIAEIKRLAAEGYGVEDICVRLNLRRKDVKPFVIPPTPRFAKVERKAS